MNISSGRPCVSICCKEDTVHPPGARCYWNVTLTTVEKLFPNYLPAETTIKDLQNMRPGYEIPCPNNAVCYSDCNLGNNISTYLFGSGMTSMNDSIDNGLACRFDARQYCFQSYRTDRMENVTSLCNTFFDMETTVMYTRAQTAIEMSYAIYPMIISCVFLVATFFIYTIIPELKNLHGLVVRTYISCCFCSFLTLTLNAKFPPISCSAFLTIPLHFSIVASCCWLNVMSFDIWWTFRSLRESSKQSPRKKYIIYSIYAWGIPMLIIGVGFLIEFLPNAPEGLIKPGLQQGCWMGGSLQIAFYIQVPLSIMVSGNICFFVLAAVSITRQKKATSQCLEGNDSRRFNDEKSRFYLYLKLFFITGMTWAANIVVFAVVVPYPRYVKYILHFPNRIQGLILFILFVCNARTKQLLSKCLGLKDRTAIQWIELAVARIGTLAGRPQVS